MDDSWEWVYELIERKADPLPELSEDLLIFFMRKSPKVQEIIDRLFLEMEI